MDKLKVTTIQTELFWEDQAANLRMFEERISAIPEKTHLIILPEMFSTGFSMQPQRLAETMDGNTVQWMRLLSKAKGSIITGSVIIEENGNYFNRLIWMLPNGELGYYDKRHCFTLAGEDKHYTAGTKRLITSVGGWRILVQICYDLRFPVWARQQVHAEGQEPQTEYDVLLNVANWPAKRSLAWKTLLQARAIENQCYAIGVNRVGTDGFGLEYSGDTTIVDPFGEVMYQQPGVEEVHTISLEKERLNQVREKLPFWRDADDFQVF
jgi:omega-amidase